MFIAPFSTYRLSAVREDLALLPTELQQDLILKFLWTKVHCLTSSFNTGQQNVFYLYFWCYPAWFHVLQRYRHYYFRTAYLNPSKYSMHPYVSFPRTNPTSPSSSPFHCHSSYPSLLSFLDNPSETGNKLVTNAIRDFSQLHYKSCISVLTAAVAAELFRGGRTARFYL